MQNEQFYLISEKGCVAGPFRNYHEVSIASEKFIDDHRCQSLVIMKQIKNLRPVVKNVKILVCCKNSNGNPDVVPVIVSCTQEEIDNGRHYDCASELVQEQGWETPAVCYDQFDPMFKIFKVEELDWKDKSMHTSSNDIFV